PSGHESRSKPDRSLLGMLFGRRPRPDWAAGFGGVGSGRGVHEEIRLYAGERNCRREGAARGGEGEHRMNPLMQLAACGQSPWPDYLKPSLVENDGLRALIERDGLKGVTSKTAGEAMVGEQIE